MNSQNFYDDFLTGVKGALGEDAENFRRAFFDAEEKQGRSGQQAPMFAHTMATNPLLVTLQDNLKMGDPVARQTRKEQGMGVPEKAGERLGQAIGRIGQDIGRDATRSIWWLLNAPQAVAQVAVDSLLARTNPDLRSEYFVRDDNDARIQYDPQDYEAAYRAGLTDQAGNLQKNVRVGPAEEYLTPDGDISNRRFYKKTRMLPGAVNWLTLPTAAAINTGLGLTNFVGGNEGYTAAIPSEEDPTKTANVIAEIGAKYILGRTGNLLPYEEFKKVRPDVSREEYNAYKAFKYDKELDYDASDGDVSLLPMGVLKATAEGIHGPEVQFLGRSLPVTTTILPTVAAALGTAAGVYGGAEHRKRGDKMLGFIPPVDADPNLKPESTAQVDQIARRTTRRGLVGGTIGAVGGALIGNVIEQERRKRNAKSNDEIGKIVEKL